MRRITTSQSRGLDAVGLYERELALLPGSAESQKIDALVRTVSDNNGGRITAEARSRVISYCLNWAYIIAQSIARQYKGTLFFDPMDLAQAASEGLIDAVDRWDAEKTSGLFTNYAKYRIRGAIMDFLRDNGRPGVKIPRSIQKLRRKVYHELAHWQAKEAPDVKQLAKLCYSTYSNVIIALGQPPILESELGAQYEEDDPEYEVFVENKTPEDSLIFLLAKDWLDKVMQNIDAFAQSRPKTKNVREILEWALWLKDIQVTEGEIGDMFGLTESRISQILREFLRFLKTNGVEIATNSAIVLREGVHAAKQIVDDHDDYGYGA